MKLSYSSISIYLILCLSSCDSDHSLNNDIVNISPTTNAPCVNGFAGIYPCHNFDLISHISLSQMNANMASDIWGWTDPTTNSEYALIGLDNGTAFIDISNPSSPVYLGKLNTASVNSPLRDIKVYQNHAFIVSEAPNHGMQVFDLTKLRDIINPPQLFIEDAHYNGFGNAHNIIINENSGYAYAVGTETFQGGPHFINIQNPTNPIAAGGFISNGNDPYSHDAQIVTYNGPDSDYTGREILIGSNQIEVVIADITDKSNPVTISTINYSNVGYTHQGWFTKDMKYFLLGDELDEQTIGFNTRTIIFDFQDLDNPVFHTNYMGVTSATDHNGYIVDDIYYLANYRAGIRAIDISNIEDSNLIEIGYFDTFPSNNNVGFDGAWSIYPYFQSKNIIVSDINSGFFLINNPSN